MYKPVRRATERHPFRREENQTRLDVPGAGSGSPLVKKQTPTIVNSLAWNTLGNSAAILFSLAALVVLSRILTPFDFGLYGMAITVLMIPETLVHGPLQESLIQRKTVDDEHINTINTVSCGLAIVAFVLICAFAPLIADLFKTTELVPVLQVTATLLLTGPFTATAASFLIRNLSFKQITYVDVVGNLVPALIGLACAILLKSVWALVWMELSKRVIRMVMFMWLSGYRPRLLFVPEKMRELAHYSGHAYLLGFVMSVQRALPSALVGAVMGAVPLGLFNMALRFFEQANQAIIMPFASVSFPMFAKHQFNRPELHKTLNQTLKLANTITLPAFMGAILLMPLLLPIMIGEQWTPAIAATQLSLILGPLTMIEFINRSLMKALGRPDLATGITVFSCLFTVVGVLSVVQFEIEAVMGVLIAQKLLTLLMMGYLVHKQAGFTPTQQVRPILLPAAASLVMGLVVLVLRDTVMLGFDPAIRAAVLIASGVATYGLVFSIVSPATLKQAIGMVARRKSA
jgi:lipopolysaccharide exporter